MESEFAKIIYAKNNGIPWQSQIAKFVSRQKNRLYGYQASYVGGLPNIADFSGVECGLMED
jgi:hypothetical protein